MRRRLLLFSTLALLALALAIGIETALAGNAVSQQATLTVSISGDGTGWVTSDPAGISCGTICSAQFAVGTTVTLKATPAVGSIGFMYCGRPPAPKLPPCETPLYKVILTGDTRVGAIFDVAPPPPTPPTPCVVPRVKGSPVDNAEDTLAEVDCRTGTITYAFSSKVKKGRVVSQSPPPRWQRLHGAVDLVVSKGRR